MAKKMMVLFVRGNEKSWTFEFEENTDNMQGWIDDGLDVRPLCNTYPKWVVDAGLRPVWAFFQDVFGFKNPWSKT